MVFKMTLKRRDQSAIELHTSRLCIFVVAIVPLFTQSRMVSESFDHRDDSRG